NDVVEWHNIYSRKSLFLPPDREPGNKDDYVCKGNWIQNALISDDEKDENTGENLKISNEDGQKERAKQTIRSFGYNYVGVDTLQRINIAVWTLKHLENEIDSFMEWYRKKLRRIGLEDIKKDRFKMGDKIK
ncbi:MAG: hypothetical protein GWN01_03805, partial [Nitrosopumilaceae archaeon]|nr:hypothetical protein [Nitrosopumilaceae archaeon]NIU86465.1 hypothetical protein [Nitrosopumilaceae archaeon]NIV65231.1 hypothetical protein [Nitrosopumilaceae archaeon]NIX60683.1 hypothetical protein [Nitrosopumilaceae archaeon]